MSEKIQNISLINLSIITIMAAWIILAIIFGFSDLEISRAIVDRNSLWGGFAADFGEAPGYALIAASLTIIMGSNLKKRNQNNLAFLGAAAGFMVFLVGLLEGSQDMMILGGSISASMTLLLALTSRRNWRSYWKISLFILLLAIIVPLVSVQGLKILSARVRFYDLASDFSNYTPWYIFQGPANIDSSFPSGHTAMGWMFLPLLVPLWIHKGHAASKIIFTGIIFGWGLFIAVNRVIIGAHYASDVLFSTGLMMLASYVIYRRLYGNRNRMMGQSLE